WILKMFAPLRTACARHYFRHLGVDQQHPPVFSTLSTLLLPKEGTQRTARWRARHLDDGECGPKLRLPLLAAWDQRPSLVAESVELVERPVLFGAQLAPCEPRVVGPVAQGAEDPALVLALGGHDVKG